MGGDDDDDSAKADDATMLCNGSVKLDAIFNHLNRPDYLLNFSVASCHRCKVWKLILFSTRLKLSHDIYIFVSSVESVAVAVVVFSIQRNFGETNKLK